MTLREGRGGHGDRDMRTRSAVTWLLLVTCLVLVANWLWAGAEAQLIGGTALGGYVADDRYFLNDHNVFMEVPRDVWIWSLVHTIATLASWPILAGIIVIKGSRGQRRVAAVKPQPHMGTDHPIQEPGVRASWSGADHD